MPLPNFRHYPHNKALLILIALILLFVMTIPVPYLAMLDSNQEEIDSMRFSLGKYLTTAERTDSLKQQINQLEGQSISSDDLLPGDSSAIAGANLQEMISQRIKNLSGGQLESTRILAVSTTDSMERITIQGHFSSDIQTLQQILYSIEFEKPLLFIDKIDIRSGKTGRRRSQSPIDILNITIDISGYRFYGESGS